MPVRDDPANPPAGRLLAGEDGRVLARFVAGDRGGARWADMMAPAPGVAVAEVVPVVLRELAGLRVGATVELGMALVAAGAPLRRHAHTMRRTLARPPIPASPPPDVRIGPVDRPPEDFGEALLAAFPRGHVDWEPGDEDVDFQVARMARIMNGEEVGPMLAASRLAVDRAGRVVGGAIVTDSGGDSPWGGPWLAELFRHPHHRGTGGALLYETLRAMRDDGLAALGLAVSEGNSARGLYEAAGFELVASFVSVNLAAPGEP